MSVAAHALPPPHPPPPPGALLPLNIAVQGGWWGAVAGAPILQCSYNCILIFFKFYYFAFAIQVNMILPVFTAILPMFDR